jgi:hypothetical protein
MTAHTPTTILSQFALRLRAVAPKEFEAFVECFDAYATEITVAVTAADQSTVLNAQGRAQFALHLLKLLRECHIQKPPPAPPPPSA